MARTARKGHRLAAQSVKAAERSRNNLEVERLTKSTSVYMKEILLDEGHHLNKQQATKKPQRIESRKHSEGGKINFNK